MIEKVIAVVNEETGKSASETSTFEELGLDSLDFVSLMLAVENKLGVRIPEEKYPTIESVADLSRVIAESH